MDLMGWGLTVVAVAALTGVLVVGHLGAVALRRCSEADIAAVLDRIIRMFATVRGDSRMVEPALPGDGEVAIPSLTEAGAGVDI